MGNTGPSKHEENRLKIPWFLYKMVGHFTMRTYGVNQEYRLVEGIWLHQKGSQIRVFSGNYRFLIHTCATRSDLPCYISTMPLQLIYLRV